MVNNESSCDREKIPFVPSMTTHSRFFVASILINLFLVGAVLWYVIFHVGISVFYAKLKAPQETFLQDRYYRAVRDRYKALNERLDRAREYVVFAGDSLVEQLPVSEYFPGGTAINRGIGMDTTRGLLERLEINVTNVPLSLCVLLIGSNDLDYRSVEETTRNIDSILQAIDARKTVVMGIPPCNDAARNREIRRLNSNYEVLVAAHGGIYVDTYTLLLGEGDVLKKDYTYDGVHLTLKGSRLLLDRIRPLAITAGAAAAPWPVTVP